MRRTLLLALSLLGGCVFVPKAPPATVMIPASMEDCPLGARVPPSLPAIVGPAELRASWVQEELARRGDHRAALECRSNLLGVIGLVNEFNDRQRQSH